MSSGSYATKAGFREDHKPTRDTRPCPSITDEPRGPGVYFAGLCITCGVSTTHRNSDGHPQHDPERKPA